MKKTQLPITLVIPHRNRFAHLKECVESVIRLKRIPELVLIIDDNSENHVVKEMKSYFVRDNVKIIALPENIGRVNAKNLGIALCKTEYIWFLDSDSEVLFADSLGYAYDILKNSQDIAVIGGEIIKSFSGELHFAETTLLPNYESRFKFHHILDDKSEEIVKEVKCIPTCNFLTKTKLLRDARGFHPFLIQGEDKLASLELIKKKYRLIITSRFGVLHKRALEAGQDRPTRLVSRHCSVFIYGAMSDYFKLPIYYIDTILGICIDMILLKRRLKHVYLFSESVRSQDKPEDKGYMKITSFFKKIFAIVFYDIALYFRVDNIKILFRGVKYKREKKVFPSLLILKSIGKFLHD